MSRPSIVVVGPEGSGTTLVWRCIAAHPELRGMRVMHAPERGRALAATGTILHLSLPTRRPMLWVGPHELPRAVRVVLVRRASVHTVYSAYRRFYADAAAAWRTYFVAAEIEQHYIRVHAPLCVYYEDLVSHPAAALPRVYRWLGIDDDFAPSIAFRGRNDGRWRRDHAFAHFMRAAFGTIRVPRAPAAARTTGAAMEPRATQTRGAAATRVVSVPEVLDQRERTALRKAIRGTARRTADASNDLGGGVTALEARLRRLLPYVRRQLGCPWFRVGRVERRVWTSGAAALDDAQGGQPSICCAYQLQPIGGTLTLVGGADARRPRQRSASIRIRPRGNSAVFFAGDVDATWRRGRGQPASRIPSALVLVTFHGAASGHPQPDGREEGRGRRLPPAPSR